jgi:dTDP-L-rhamnose 4-epimerase
VRVLDCLDDQVHKDQTRPTYLDPAVDLHEGCVTDKEAVKKALEDVDRVVHLAAAVGVGQSMYEIAHYTRINNQGTAGLLEVLIDNPVKKLLVASSMSIYGEGLYQDRAGRPVSPTARSKESLAEKRWDLHDSNGDTLIPIPTPEKKCPEPASVYALGKYDQEKLCLLMGKAYDISTVAMRFFNVYGPRQSLSNPYTGVLAIFASRLLNDHPPLIFEDGLQQRDFVSVYDIAQACYKATMSEVSNEVFNVGCGQQVSILEVAQLLQKVLGKPDLDPRVTGKYRVGDIRNCFADIGKARRMLGYEPQVKLEEGVEELAEFLEGQIVEDRAEQATAELQSRGLAF